MAFVTTRRYDETLKLTTADGTEIVITFRRGHSLEEIRLVVEAPRSVVVEQPKR
jgi:hypothetical protein